MLGRIAVLLVVLVAAAVLAAVLYEPDRSTGTIAGAARPPARVAASDGARAAARIALRARALRSAPGGEEPVGQALRSEASKQILFGDLHVHTTFSIDAFVYSLPVLGGEGARPPADACDFARHCAALDFFSINDHAEGLVPPRWAETIESIRQCNAVANDPADPDLVAYVGYEWTQTGPTPETHFGHRNVIFPGLSDDALPARPITSLPDGTTDRARAMWLVGALSQLGPFGLGPYADLLWLLKRIVDTPDCRAGVDSRDLPPDCRENAETPAALFEKLAQWDLDHLVIPHGLAWGIHAPPGARIDNALRGANHDPGSERLIEVFSGHGNGEEFRAFAEFATGEDGERICPEPSPAYLPCCWRAGEIMRERCGDLPEDECEARVAEARQLALEAGNQPHRVFPDARAEDWLDCDQCRDCFKPAATLRPGETAQYSLAVANFEALQRDGRPRRFRWGFIASTDNHAARPGTGYKQYARRVMTDAKGFTSELTERLARPYVVGRQEDPQRAQAVPEEPRGFRGLFDSERVSSFLYPGGIVAAHASGRDRGAIWEALERREVYGTSGPRILLWLDLLNAPGGPAPMGSEVEMEEAPLFEVRAAGDWVQKPGCPDWSVRGLPPERLTELCLGECYHPGDRRHPIAAIEIVRIHPQAEAGESVGTLIQDPWRRFECAPDPAGCTVRFADPEYPASGRDAVYYARVLQEATPAINGANLRTEFDSRGNAVSTSPCHGNYRTPPERDCLAPVQERAWSSPIYVDQPRGRARGQPHAVATLERAPR